MKSELISKVSRYYGDKINAFGITPKGVDWEGEYSQNLRFAQLLKVVRERRNIILNDLGCGYGAIFLYGDTRNWVSNYYGYDICEEILVQAKNLINDSRAVFIKSDRITMEADYSVASGIFNVKLDTERKVWEEFILDTLVNMNAKSLIGFAFNCLTSYVDYKEGHLYYGNPLYYFNFCKRSFSKYVTLIHDYELYEWTILVRKIQ